MSTVVVGKPDWLSEILRRRHEQGHDLFDEVWDGVSHLAPNAGVEHGRVAVAVVMALAPASRRLGLAASGPFTLGAVGDFRVPDGGWFRTRVRGTYAPTALAVLEVLSPGDETYAKFGFYLQRGVQEILVAHPTERWIHCHVNDGTSFASRSRSVVFEVTMEQLTAAIDW